MSEGHPEIERRGLMLVLSSPSGAGKTTLARALLQAESGIDMSVSVTTRPKRPGEVEGKDYIFVSQEEFSKLRDKGDLLEWALVDRKSTRLNSSHTDISRMPSSA